MTTRRRAIEKLCFQLSVHSKLELDCIENSCAEELTLQSNYFHTVRAVQKSAQARPQYSMNELVVVMMWLTKVPLKRVV